MSTFIDLTGKTFGRLIVIREVIWKSKSQNTVWYCKCECGNEAVVYSGNLIKGHTKSCGCLHPELVRKRFTSHGLSKHPLHSIWHGINERCYKTYSISYKRYGLCGVTVCDEWRYNFQNFYNWSMANGWQPGLRIDKDIIAQELNVPANLYSPDRCKWVTVKINCRHRRSVKLNEQKVLEIKNSSKTTKELMAQYGVGKTTIGNIRGNRSWL